MGPSQSFKPFRTIEELLWLREMARELQLEAPADFWSCNAAQLQHAYNGIGAEWQSRAVRSLQTALYSELEPVALIHDYAGCFENDRTRSGFRRWNRRYWWKNGLRLCRRRYRWCDWRRYRGLFRVLLLYRLLCRFGFRAWREAAPER